MTCKCSESVIKISNFVFIFFSVQKLCLLAGLFEEQFSFSVFANYLLTQASMMASAVGFIVDTSAIVYYVAEVN